MTVRTTLVRVCLALVCITATPAVAADARRDIHGMADAYAGEGVAHARLNTRTRRSLARLGEVLVAHCTRTSSLK